MMIQSDPVPVAAQNGSTSRPCLGYILAASHSGSTLLAMLLGSHPEACTAGELKGPSHASSTTYRCSCGSLIRECAFWRSVESGMSRRGLSYDVVDTDTNVQKADDPFVRRVLSPLHRGPALEWLRDAALKLSPVGRDHLRRIQTRNVALVETLLEVSRARVVVDSSKTGLRAKYLLRIPHLDVRLIRLIRDGRAVALTHMHPSEFADATQPDRRSGGSGGRRTGMSMAEAAWLWRRSNEEAEHLVASLDPSQYLEVRYEELCLRPRETLRKVCEFLGLSAEKIAADFRNSKQQHVVGNGMRFDTTSEIRLDERWRQHLSREELEEFEAKAGDLNRRYGYVT